MDYSKSLNLPETEFPMRASLPQREPETLKKWEDENLYEQLLLKNKGKEKFILHDGPPYANGDIHAGHTLNKILKDIVVRFKNMEGFCSPYVPGWDTHGLPIERQAIAKLGVNRHEVGVVKFREICRDFALKYVSNQREQFKRLGVLGDWEHPYLTLAPEFEAKQIEIFGEMARKGYIYRGLKPVYWCPDCQTALAEAEIEYAEDKTNSIFVKFLVKDDKGKFSDIKEKVYFVIWTTTTWTLPGNVAISLNPKFEYSLILVADEVYVIATDLVESTLCAAGMTDYETVAKFTGAELENMTCYHPFMDRESLIIVGDHVTMEAGTGCVHTAPGHGVEDFIACQNYDLPIIVPVDDKGYLNEFAGKFSGMYYEKSNAAIVSELKENNLLFAISEIIHPYPHCWRCNYPILFRATDQWFVTIESFRENVLAAIKTVNWMPTWGEDRISAMVRDRADWCISRQRIWGVPIPIFYCDDCKKPLINEETIKAVAALFKQKGSDAWYATDAKDILPVGTKCECGCSAFTKETDIMDVWFDSGSSHMAVLETREDLSRPADLYLEGHDQYRGWFQSSLLTSVAVSGIAPYKSVLTHAWVVDGDGLKMSKSKGNGVDPMELVAEYGADVLRLWIISSDYKSDVRISKDILKQISEGYRKIRNTSRFILGNIKDFSPDTDMVSYKDMQEIDKVALQKLNKLTQKIMSAYRSYDFHLIYHALYNFCVVDMSNFYLDIIKDRLYTEKSDSLQRRSAQSAMYTILDTLVRLITPVISFTAEEIWAFMPHSAKHDLGSIMFNSLPDGNNEFENQELEEKWDRILEFKTDIAKSLENARANKVIGHSLNAAVTVFAGGADYAFLKAIEAELVAILIVSGVTVKEISEAPADLEEGETKIKTLISQAPGDKCERCWMFSETVGENDDHPTLCNRCATVVR